MNVKGKHYRTVWLADDGRRIAIIDQRHLPHRFVIEELSTVEEVAVAIREMHVRGAGLIGAAAGYGMYLAACEGEWEAAALRLKATRPCHVVREFREVRQRFPIGADRRGFRRVPGISERDPYLMNNAVHWPLRPRPAQSTTKE